jgi:hypothetical protein
MKWVLLILSASFCLGATLAIAADIPLQTPTTITGTISGAKGEFYISTRDTVSGPGNGFHLSHEPTRHCMLSLEALSPAKRKTLEQELAEKASNGQPMTLHGEYFPLKEREETTHHRVAFEVSG